MIDFKIRHVGQYKQVVVDIDSGQCKYDCGLLDQHQVDSFALQLLSTASQLLDGDNERKIDQLIEQL